MTKTPISETKQPCLSKKNHAQQKLNQSMNICGFAPHKQEQEHQYYITHSTNESQERKGE